MNSWIRTRNSWIRTRNSWIRTRNSWIWTRNSWIWISTRFFEFQLALLSFVLPYHKKDRFIAKWVLKMWINTNKRHFLILPENCTHKSIKPRRRTYNITISAKWKEVKGKPDKINGLILKTKDISFSVFQGQSPRSESAESGFRQIRI